MANEYYWKVWLRPNLLTKDDDNDYVAEVLTQKDTLRNENIANAIIKEGSEIKYDTLLSIIKQRDRIVREHLMLGYSVLTDVCQFTPRVTGKWDSETAKYDPAIHKLTLDIVPCDLTCDALSKVGIEVLGAKGEVSRIGKVTDTLTGLANGWITPNEDIQIDGDRIRINGSDSSVGIFFVAEDGKTATPVTRRLTQNDPSRIIARVPALTDGKYTLRIVTQFSKGATLLKAPRTIEYKIPLVVGEGGGDSESPDEI